MVFKRSFFPPSQQHTWDDRFCRVEMSTSFKRITCPRCDLEAIYKYEVRQIRRRSEILVHDGEEIRPDHEEIWKSSTWSKTDFAARGFDDKTSRHA